MTDSEMNTEHLSIPELIKAARDELHDGSTEGVLAFWRNDRGDREVRLSRSDALIRVAESKFQSDDFDGAVALWGAFKSGLGCRDNHEANLRAFRYISFLAEAGNVAAQEVLLVDYLHGLNGLEKDAQKFLYWCDRAIQGGSKLAKEELEKFKNTLGNKN